MDEDLEYGPILITKGPLKGHIGYYDDDDDDEKLIVYPRIPIYCSRCYLINRKYATSVIPTNCIAQRWYELDNIISQSECGIIDLSTEEYLDLLHERIFCTDLLNDRHFKAMQKVEKQEHNSIFISHSSKDMVFSRGLATDLLDAGYAVFLDDWSINISDRIFEKINDGLNESTAFIMILSRDYLESVCCKDEWGAFYGKALHNKNCRIYPVILDDSEPPALLSQIKYLKFTDDNYTYNLSLLLKALYKQFKETSV